MIFSFATDMTLVRHFYLPEENILSGFTKHNLVWSTNNLALPI